jgi:hypothetical protein
MTLINSPACTTPDRLAVCGVWHAVVRLYCQNLHNRKTAKPQNLQNCITFLAISYQLSAFCPVPCALSCSIPGGTTTLNRKSRKINELRDFVFQRVMPACILNFNHETTCTML